MPSYLSRSTAQGSFDQMIQQSGGKAASAVDIEPLRQIASLVHHCTVLELQRSLWSSYLQCGTGRRKPNRPDVLFWPASVLTKMRTLQGRPANNDADETCSQFVREHLHTLTDQQHDSRRQLQQRSQQVDDFARSFEQAIEAFVQQGLTQTRAKYAYKMKLVEFDYDQRALECEFRQQTTSDEQVRSATASMACTLVSLCARYDGRSGCANANINVNWPNKRYFSCRSALPRSDCPPPSTPSADPFRCRSTRCTTSIRLDNYTIVNGRLCKSIAANSYVCFWPQPKPNATSPRKSSTTPWLNCGRSNALCPFRNDSRPT